MKSCRLKASPLASLSILLMAGSAVANERFVRTTTSRILDSTGVQGGIIVHLGCGDDKLTAAFRVSDRYTAQETAPGRLRWKEI